MSIYKRGNIWYCRLRNAEGKMVRRALSDNKEVAKTIVGKMRQEYVLQKAGVVPVQTLPGEITAIPRTPKQIFRTYLDQQSAKGKSASWEQGIDLAWRQCIDTHEFTSLNQFQIAHVQAWIKKCKEKGNTGQTINQRASLLKKFCDWAVWNGFMEKNPFTGWETIKHSSQKFRRDLTTEEMSRILDAEKDPDLHLLWLLYAFTGLRRSSGKLLDWKWISWETRMICLPAEANKSARDHRIPIHLRLYEALESRWRALGCPTMGAVFPPHINPLEKFKDACRRVGIDLRGVCLHSVRHTVASRVYEATGGNIKAVQEILGHADIGTTAKYLHIKDGVKREAISALAY